MSGVSSALGSKQLTPIILVTKHNILSPITLTLDALILGGKAPYTVVWNIDGKDFKQEIPTTVTLNKGVHIITLTVKDANGTIASSELELNIPDTSFIEILGVRINISPFSESISNISHPIGDSPFSESILSISHPIGDSPFSEEITFEN